jgi:hypothetical protein
VSLGAHVRSSPFIFPLNNSLETANLTMVMFNYLADILFSSNLLSNFDGMDMLVVTVNCAAILLMIIAAILLMIIAAILLMIIAACWVWKLAPDLSNKLRVSQHLLLPTVLSKLSQRFTVSNSTDIEMQKTAAATDAPPAAAALASDVPNVPFDLLTLQPQRCQAQLHLPNLPPMPPPTRTRLRSTTYESASLAGIAACDKPCAQALAACHCPFPAINESEPQSSGRRVRAWCWDAQRLKRSQSRRGRRGGRDREGVEPSEGSCRIGCEVCACAKVLRSKRIY